MKKSVFKQIVDMLRRRKAGFTKIVSNPGGTKYLRACKHESRRGADYTMR